MKDILKIVVLFMIISGIIIMGINILKEVGGIILIIFIIYYIITKLDKHKTNNVE